MGCMNLNKIEKEDLAPSDMDDVSMSEKKAEKKKSNKAKYKKAPQAPRRFKSAYMFFSTTKHKEIRDDLGTKGLVEKVRKIVIGPMHKETYIPSPHLHPTKTTNIAKLVSKAWKDLTPEEKDFWDEHARRDKARFEVEKSLYTGPWKVPAKKRSQKDPDAPKRPMSAFLAYSHAKRAEVKKKNPNMNNADTSRVLAQLWKDAPEEEKKEHIEKEYELRQKYLSEIAVWRENTEKEFNEQRKSREDIAMKTVAARSSARSNDGQLDMHTADSHEKDRETAEQGPGDYSAYYPQHHTYYPPTGPSHGPYVPDYPPPYPPPYYHPASSQYPPAEHYEQASRPATETSQDGYSEYYAHAGYGQYPPGGSSSVLYLPGGHEQYPSTGYNGGHSGYPPPKGNAAAASYGSYYDQHTYQAPPAYGDAPYDRDQYPNESRPRHFFPPRYGGEPMDGNEAASASAIEPDMPPSDRKR